MLRNLFAVAVATCMFAALGQVQAAPVTIDFEDVAVGNGVNSIGGDITSQGFLFDSPTNHTHRANNAFGLNNGTTWMGNDDFPPAGAFNAITMTQVGGGAFDLLGVDLAQWVSAGGAATTITVLGNYSGGGSTSQAINITGSFGSFLTTAFGAGWANLSSVVFTPSGGGDPENWWAVDNVQVDNAPAAVPEPTSMALFGLTALGLAAVRRRRQNAVDQLV